MRIVLIGNYPPDRQWSMRRFTEQLQSGLEAQNVSVEIYLPKVLVGRLGAKPSGFGKWLGYVDKYLLAPILLRLKLRTLPPDSVLHICDHSNAIYTKSLKKRPHLVTCHDLLAVRSALGEIPQNQPKWTGKIQQSMILRGLKRSRLIASVSEATRKDVARLIGDHSEWQYLVPNSLNDDFIEEAISKVRNRTESLILNGYSDDIRYIIHIGGEKWYKNRKAVFQIFQRLEKRDKCLQLFVVGPRFSDSDLEKYGCLGIKDKIHYFSGISDDDLRALYKNAEMLLFPSLMEGFGWPILEAQACGCPVATFAIEPMSSLNALPGLTVSVDMDESDQIDRFADVCLSQLGLESCERAKQQEKIQTFAANFSNDASAEAYIDIYKRLLGESDQP